MANIIGFSSLFFLTPTTTLKPLSHLFVKSAIIKGGSCKFYGAKTRWRTNHRERHHSLMAFVKSKKLIQIDVADAIAAGHHEFSFAD